MPPLHIRSVQLLAISAGSPGRAGRAVPQEINVVPLTDHRPLVDAPADVITV